MATIEGGLSGMMVLEDDDEHHVVGLLTSRDLLRIVASGVKEGLDNDEIMTRKIDEYMTDISQVIYGRPEETVGMCRTIMAKLGIKCLPILSREGRVEGLLTARDMSDFGLTAKEKGGKEAYLKDVSNRVGLSSNTRYDFDEFRGTVTGQIVVKTHSLKKNCIFQHGRAPNVHESSFGSGAIATLCEYWESIITTSLQDTRWGWS